VGGVILCVGVLCVWEHVYVLWVVLCVWVCRVANFKYQVLHMSNMIASFARTSRVYILYVR